MIDLLDLNSKNSIWREVPLITCSILALPYSERVFWASVSEAVYRGNVQSEQKMNEQSQVNLIQSSQELRAGWKFMFQHEHTAVTMLDITVKDVLPNTVVNQTPSAISGKAWQMFVQQQSPYIQTDNDRIRKCSAWNEMNRNRRKKFWLHWWVQAEILSKVY